MHTKYLRRIALDSTPSVPICKHPFIREKKCLHIGTEGVLYLCECGVYMALSFAFLSYAPVSVQLKVCSH